MLPLPCGGQGCGRGSARPGASGPSEHCQNRDKSPDLCFLHTYDLLLMPPLVKSNWRPDERVWRVDSRAVSLLDTQRARKGWKMNPEGQRESLSFISTTGSCGPHPGETPSPIRHRLRWVVSAASHLQRESKRRRQWATLFFTEGNRERGGGEEPTCCWFQTWGGTLGSLLSLPAPTSLPLGSTAALWVSLLRVVQIFIPMESKFLAVLSSLSHRGFLLAGFWTGRPCRALASPVERDQDCALRGTFLLER